MVISNRIQNLWIDNNEPPQTNVVWIRPNWGTYYYDEGRWIPILGNCCILKEDLISGIDLGGVHFKDLFVAGTPIEEVLRILLKALSNEDNKGFICTGGGTVIRTGGGSAIRLTSLN